MRLKYGRLAVCSAVAVASLAGTASAAPGNGNGYGNGNQGCQLNRAPGQEFKNPGKTFQYMRSDAHPDENPKDVVNAYPNDFRNVGDLVHQKCSG